MFCWRSAAGHYSRMIGPPMKSIPPGKGIRRMAPARPTQDATTVDTLQNRATNDCRSVLPVLSKGEA